MQLTTWPSLVPIAPTSTYIFLFQSGSFILVWSLSMHVIVQIFQSMYDYYDDAFPPHHKQTHYHAHHLYIPNRQFICSLSAIFIHCSAYCSYTANTKFPMLWKCATLNLFIAFIWYALKLLYECALFFWLYVISKRFTSEHCIEYGGGGLIQVLLHLRFIKYIHNDVRCTFMVSSRCLEFSVRNCLDIELQQCNASSFFFGFSKWIISLLLVRK